MNKLFTITYLLLLAFFVSAQSVEVINFPLTPNSNVRATKIVGNTLYIGGDFTLLNANTGSVAAIAQNGNVLNVNIPVVIGTTNTIARDVLGRYIIGGTFTSVGGQVRNRFAILNADFSLNTANVSFNGEVRKIVVHNNIAYVFGSFTEVNGLSRNMAAAINLSNFSVTSWNPNFIGGVVHDVLINNNRLIVAGNFRISGYSFNKALASFNLNNNGVLQNYGLNVNVGYYTQVPQWCTRHVCVRRFFGFCISSVTQRYICGTTNIFQNDNGTIRSISINRSTNRLYFGGDFTHVNQNINYTHIGSIDLNSLMVQQLSGLSLDNPVNSLVWFNNNLYVGGSFTTVNGINRPRLFAYNTNANSVLNTWAPNPNSNITKIGVVGNLLWVSGSFTTIASNSRTRLALFDLNTNSNIAPVLNNVIAPNPNGLFMDAIAFANNIVAVGSFSSAATIVRNRIAAFDINNNSLLPFSPSIDNGTVCAIEATSFNVLIGGNFSLVNGVSVGGFVAINPTSSQIVSNMQANFDGSILTLAVNGNTIFAGGNFTRVSIPRLTQTRPNLTSITALDFQNNLIDFNTTFFNPILRRGTIFSSTTATVNVLRIINGSLFIGGNFNAPNSFRNGLISANPSSGVLNPFNANFSSNTEITDIIQNTSNEIVASGNINYGGATFAPPGLSYLNSFTGVTRLTKMLNNGRINKIILGYINDVFAATNNGIVRISNSNGTNSDLISGINAETIEKTDNLVISGGSFNNVLNQMLITNILAFRYNFPLPPNLAPTNLSFSNISSNSMSISWTNGNGSRRLVLMRAESPVSIDPDRGEIYTASDTYGNGSNIGGAFVVFNGTGNSVNVSNLQPGIRYHVRVVEYNGNEIPVYGRSLDGSEQTIVFNPPSISASNIIASNITVNSMNISWTNGNGMKRLVVARQGNPVNFVPEDNRSYVASNSFGNGQNLGNGNFVVFNGTGNNFNLTNLLSGTNYHFAVFEYNEYQNGIITRYRTLQVPTANANTLPLAPLPTQPAQLLTANTLNDNSVQLNWTNGNGGNRLVLCMQASNPQIVATNAANGVAYLSNNNLSNEFGVSYITVQRSYQNSFGSFIIDELMRVVYNGNANNCVVTGLSPNTSYHFIVLEYNEIGPNTQRYLNTTNPNVNYLHPQLLSEPSLSASDFNGNASDSAMIVRWQNGNGNNRLVVAKKGSPVNFIPQENVTYNASSVFGSGTNYNNGNFIVYDGTQNNVLLTNLEPYTDYYFAVYEYNLRGLQRKYKTSEPGTGFKKTQPPRWPRAAGGTSADAAGGIDIDGDSNVYICGTFKGTAFWGITSKTGSENDIYLSKYNKQGKLLWVSTAGGTGADAASSVAVDANRNAYVVGSFRNQATFDSINKNSAGSDDAFIAKYNSNGVVQWVTAFGGNGQDVAYGITLDSSGNVVVTGYFSATVSFGSQILVSSGNFDIFVAKLNASNGNFIWATKAGGSNYDYAYAVTTGSNKSIIIVGEFKESASFGSTTLTATGNFSDAYIAKLDSNGNFIWATRIGASGEDAAYSVSRDANDNYYVGGKFSNSIQMGSINLTSSGVGDGFLCKVNSNGNFTNGWAKKIGGVGEDVVLGLSVKNNFLYAIGNFTNSINVESRNLSTLGGADIFVVVYNTNGSFVDISQYGGSGNEQGKAIQAINNDNIYIGGYFSGTTDFDGFDITATKPTGNSDKEDWDLFVHKVGVSNTNLNIASDMIAWYKLNNNFTDFSGNNYHGTSSGTIVAISDRNQTNDNAMKFNTGSKMTFNIPSNNYPVLNQFTFSSWVRLDQSSGNISYLLSNVIDIDYNKNIEVFLTTNNNKVSKITAYLNDGSGPTTIQTNIINSEFIIPIQIDSSIWFHLTTTFKSGDFFRIYINGVLVKNENLVNTKVINFNNRNYTLNSHDFNGISYYSGAISYDDTRLYAKALAQREILEIINQPSSATSPPIEKAKGSLVNNDKAVLWPNPSNGNFSVQYNLENNTEITYTLVDITGKVMFNENKGNVEAGTISHGFNINNLQTGYYFLQVKDNNNKVLKYFKLAIGK